MAEVTTTPETAVCQPVHEYEKKVAEQNRTLGKELQTLNLPQSSWDKVRGKAPQIDTGAVESAVTGSRNAYANLSEDDKRKVNRSPVGSAVTGQYETPDQNIENQAVLADLRRECKSVTPTPDPVAATVPKGSSPPETLSRKIDARQKREAEILGETSQSSSTLGQERAKMAHIE